MAYALLGLIVLAIALPFWPGWMTPDTFSMFEQMTTGRYSDWGAWSLLKLWAPFYRAGIGPGIVLLVTLSVIVVGVYLSFRGLFARIGAALATALVLLNPIVYGSLATINRDNWLVAGAMLASGSLVRLTNRQLAHRTLWRVAFMLGLALALMARQNAPVAMLPLAIGFFWIEALTRERRQAGASGSLKIKQILVVGAKGLAVTVAIVVVLFGLRPLAGVKSAHPETPLLAYDLLGISQMTGQIEFSKRTFPRQDMAYISSYTPYGRWTMVDGSYGIGIPIPEWQYRSLRRDWMRAIQSHPFEYFKVRTRALMYQTGVLGTPQLVYYNQIDPNNFGLKFRNPRLKGWADRYASSLSRPDRNGIAVHRDWIYLVLLAFAAWAILKSSIIDPRLRAAYLANGLTSYATQVGLFFSTLAVELRFERQARISAMIVIVVGFTLWHRAKYEKRQVQKSS